MKVIKENKEQSCNILYITELLMYEQLYIVGNKYFLASFMIRISWIVKNRIRLICKKYPDNKQHKI